MNYKYSNLSELLYASYSGLQALAFAVQKGLQKYDRGCYAFRESVIKKYRAGEMRIGDLYENNIRQMMSAHDTCWYCGCPVAECGALTADHIFPRAKGGANVSDNLIMVCRPHAGDPRPRAASRLKRMSSQRGLRPRRDDKLVGGGHRTPRKSVGRGVLSAPPQAKGQLWQRQMKFSLALTLPDI